MLHLFDNTPFTTTSGLAARHKIECDALGDADIETLAEAMLRITGPVCRVHGVPTGGTRLAFAVGKRLSYEAGAKALVVDDVFTTGRSIEQERDRMPKDYTLIIGMVVFARGPLPSWVGALYMEHRDLWPRVPVAPKSPLELVMEMDAVKARITVNAFVGRPANMPIIIEDILIWSRSWLFGARTTFAKYLAQVVAAEHTVPAGASLSWPDAAILCTPLTYARAYIMAIWEIEAKRVAKGQL